MREKRTFAQEYCVKSAGKAMQQLHMVQPGSRIGIAVSVIEDINSFNFNWFSDISIKII